MTRPTNPIAAPRSLTGKIIKNTVVINGSMIPAPHDWIILPSKRISKLGANPQSKLPHSKYTHGRNEQLSCCKPF